MRVAIIDHGLCNMDSIARAVECCDGDPIVTARPESLGNVHRVVLPGVGAFPKAMARLHEMGMVEALDDAVRSRGVPVLGICLGMQLMMTSGDEGGTPTPGLGWIEGTVTRLQPNGGERVPHVGWNSVEPSPGRALADSVVPGTDFYFVHSFHVLPTVESTVAATTPYAGTFVSSVASGPCLGVQFHPEKSQKAGFAVIRDFVEHGSRSC